ncbi:MAG: hypothetical protein LUF68_04285 [Clostridiales bacterium]|nr:hypothetical protein [Clostridiales bacterium]
MLNFILGVFVGGIVSAVTVALCVAARDRDAILAYVNAGHSYMEAGVKYGLSKNAAVAAAKRAKAKED